MWLAAAILAVNLPAAINRFANTGKALMVSKKAIADIEKVIEEMTLQELVAHKKAVDDWITTKQGEERDKFIAETRQRAEQLGFDLGDLFPSSPMRARRASSDGVRASPRVKYRNPKNHEEIWSGRGRQAKWLTREIADGKNLESFLVE